jgi:hypothetical protein
MSKDVTYEFEMWKYGTLAAAREFQFHDARCVIGGFEKYDDRRL